MKRTNRPFALVCALGLLLAVGFYMHSCANSRARVEAAEAYMLEENPAKWRDQRAKLFESVAAFRAMEGGA